MAAHGCGLCGCRTRAALLAALSIALPVAAQEPGELPPETGAEPADITAAAEAPLPPYADGHRWIDLGLDRALVAATVTQGGVVLALDDRGAVWRWRSGRDWRRVLSPLLEDAEEVDSEDVLLEVESSVEDFMQGAEDSDTPTDDTTDVSTDEVDAGVQEIDTDEAVQAGLLDTEDGGTAGAEAPSAMGLWAPSGWPGVVLCSRQDGTFWSGDNGWSWTQITTLPPTYTLIEEPFEDAVLVAGTTEGLRHSPDGGRTWLQISDVVGGLPVLALATDGEAAYAGTTEGLFVSWDGIAWAKVLPPRYADTPVFAVATDPAWSGGLWVAGPEGVLRSDDRGEHMRAPAQNPLVGTRSFAVLPEPGHLLAAGTQGVWESVDGGTRWRPLTSGLSAAEQAAVVVGPDGPITAGPRGVYRVVRVVLTAPGGVAAVQRPEVLPPVGELVMVALRRTGVDIEPLLLQRAMLRSLLAPQLGLEGSLTQRHDLHADIPGAANTGSSAQVWIIRLDLCFGACGSSSSTIATDAADYIADDSQFVVIEGEAYLADDVGSYSAASANVAERISKYRSDIAQTVSGLYYSRQRLTRERAGISGLPLREQVDHEIGIQEVTARLDAWTDGYFSQAIDGPDLE